MARKTRGGNKRGKAAASTKEEPEVIVRKTSKTVKDSKKGKTDKKKALVKGDEDKQEEIAPMEDVVDYDAKHAEQQGQEKQHINEKELQKRQTQKDQQQGEQQQDEQQQDEQQQDEQQQDEQQQDEQQQNEQKQDHDDETNVEEELIQSEEQMVLDAVTKTSVEEMVQSAEQVILDAAAEQRETEHGDEKKTSKGAWQKLFDQLTRVRQTNPEHMLEKYKESVAQELAAQASLVAQLKEQVAALQDVSSEARVNELEQENLELKHTKVELSEQIKALHAKAAGAEEEENKAQERPLLSHSEEDELRETLAELQKKNSDFKHKEQLFSSFTGLRIELPVCNKPRYTCWASCKKRGRAIKYELEETENGEWSYIPLKGNYFPEGMKEELLLPKVQLPELFAFMQYGMFNDEHEIADTPTTKKQKTGIEENDMDLENTIVARHPSHGLTVVKHFG